MAHPRTRCRWGDQDDPPPSACAFDSGCVFSAAWHEVLSTHLSCEWRGQQVLWSGIYMSFCQRNGVWGCSYAIVFAARWWTGGLSPHPSYEWRGCRCCGAAPGASGTLALPVKTGCCADPGFWGRHSGDLYHRRFKTGLSPADPVESRQERSRGEAEWRRNAAGERGVQRRRRVCLPVLHVHTQGRLAEARLTLGLNTQPLWGWCEKG